MNNEASKLRMIIGVLMFVVVIMSYYVGYFSSKLGFDAPFIPNSGTKVSNNQQAPKTEDEFKPVENVAYFDLKGDEITKGDINSSIVLVEFTDLQCPFCARFHPTVETVLQKNKVKLVTKHFPLSFHKYAKDYAVMFECIAKNNNSNQAYDFINNLFDINIAKKGVVTLDDGVSEAEKLGLNKEKFEECKNDSVINQKIKDNFEEGIKLGINGTPAMYILNTSNKKAVRLNGLVEESVIQAELEKISK